MREPFNVNAAAQIAALAALEDEEHVRRSRELNEAGKAWLYLELEKLGLEYVPSQTNFIFVDLSRTAGGLPAPIGPGIIARSGGVFGCPSWLRVSIGTEEENCRLIEALAEVLER